MGKQASIKKNAYTNTNAEVPYENLNEHPSKEEP